jgi:hypothetical protein
MVCAPLENGNVHSGQGQLSGQHQPRRTASGNSHGMLTDAHFRSSVSMGSLRLATRDHAAATER